VHPASPLSLRADPAACPAGAQIAQPLDLIFIEGLVGQTVIGIHASELDRPQALCIDVHAGIVRVRACRSDRIVDTIDYSVVRERLLAMLAGHRLQLLEAFAEAIADLLLDEFGAEWVRVKVVKPRKFDDVAAVGVQIERVRSAVARPGIGSGANVLRQIGAGTVPADGGATGRR